MFIPLRDDNPLDHITAPWVTRGLMLTNVLIWLVFQSGTLVDADQASMISFGVIPAVILDGAILPAGFLVIPKALTFITYAFLHGGFAHLLGNMIFLHVFGDNVEDALGHARYLLFYLACAVAGALAHAFAVPNSEQPLVGASAAIAGIVAAYLVLHPNIKMWILLFFRLPLKLPAWTILGAWIVFQIWHVTFATADGTAWWAHVGGIIAGAILVVFLRRPEMPLFDMRHGVDSTLPPR